MKNPTLVSAPAGSGKTTRLVQEYLRLLQRRDADRVVAITFTRKAAAELIERVSSVLRAILGERSDEDTDVELYRPFAPEDPARVREALAKLSGAPIGTVDSFVQRLLQEQILHAHLPLPDGGKAWLDGFAAITAGTDAYELAAREVLEGRSAAAELVLKTGSFSEAVGAVALLARRPALGRLSAEAFRDALAEEVRRDLEKWRAVTDKQLSKAYKASHDVVSAWLAAPDGPAPDALVPWMLGRTDAQKAAAAAEIGAAARAIGVPLSDDGASSVELDARWIREGCLAQADALAGALEELARAARVEALRAIAANGAAGYAELLLAATALCRARPATLVERYDALLVDEVQDTSAEQLDFYRAFASLRDDGADPIEAFFVGDVRQSIYRFRDADPTGWARLESEASGTALDANYRSSKRLVDAQMKIFSAPEGTSAAEWFPGVVNLGVITAGRRSEGLEQPISVVQCDDKNLIDAHTIHHFAARLREHPCGAAHKNPWAAVLSTSWGLAAKAKEVLRAHGIAAQLAGDKSLLASRVAADLRLFVRALLDRTDDVAMVGVLKHPSIGVGDDGLHAIRTYAWPGGPATFGVIFDERRDAEWPDLIKEAFARGAGPLRAAQRRFGREPTADVLERLVADLRWRPLLEHGPEGEHGEAVAQLEVLLEVIRQIEEPIGTEPHEVLARLEGADENAQDLPAIRLQTGDDVVTITTIHGAKGLQWDHVAMIGLCGKKIGNADSVGVAVTVHHPDNPFGVEFDPAGALTPARDPIAALWGVADAEAGLAELGRLFYVALTRAAESVTLGVPTKGGNAFAATLREKVVSLGEPTLRLVTLAEQDLKVAPPIERQPMALLDDLCARWTDARARKLASPSALTQAMSKADADAVHAQLLARATVLTSTRPVGSRPLVLSEDDPRDVGELVHGWLEHWAFDGEPTPAKAVEYLNGAYRIKAEQATAIGGWLCTLGGVLANDLPEFAALVRDARALRFEQPLLGALGDTILNGRTDLVVERADGSVMVIDFKAGKVPEDPLQPSREYTLQLHAYEQVLRDAGREVSEVGLLFVQGVTWVRFPARP